MTEISYRPYESGDEKAILETFNLVFREVCGEGYQDRDMERWCWSFLENPAGYRIMLGMTEDGRVACQYAGIPMKVYTSAGTGQELSFFHAVDSMVHPEFRAGIRKKGAFIEVAKRFFDRFGGSTDELGFGYPVRPAWRIGERYLGYRLIKSLDFLLAEIDVRPSPVPTAVQVEQIERFDAGQDELYESLKNEFPCMLIKDSRYLNWRYADCEDVDYRILQATAEGKARGYLVLRTEASLVPDSATIGDLLVHPADSECLDALLASAEQLAAAAGCKQLLTVQNDKQAFGEAFLARSFHAEPSANWLERKLGSRDWTSGLTQEWLGENWVYMLGDSDLF